MVFNAFSTIFQSVIFIFFLSLILTENLMLIKKIECRFVCIEIWWIIITYKWVIPCVMRNGLKSSSVGDIKDLYTRIHPRLYRIMLFCAGKLHKLTYLHYSTYVRTYGDRLLIVFYKGEIRRFIVVIYNSVALFTKNCN